MNATVEFVKFTSALNSLTQESRTEFFNKVSEVLTTDEVKQLQIGTALTGLYSNPRKCNAFKDEMKEWARDYFVK